MEEEGGVRMIEGVLRGCSRVVFRDEKSGFGNGRSGRTFVGVLR